MARRINQTFRKMPELQAELDKLLYDIDGKGQKAGLALKEVLRDAAEPVRVDAENNAPFLNGETKTQVFADRGDPNKASVIVGVDTNDAPQAQWQEFGTAGPHPNPPRPFMRPAVESNRANVRTIIADGVRKIVEEYR
jgi:HK97 gp10 family phage protein